MPGFFVAASRPRMPERRLGGHMKKIVLACSAASFLLLLSPVVHAQGVEAVVVSSSRSSDAMPGVTFIKRADFLITRVRVTCDTRDPKQRREELKATLLSMIQTAARTPTLSLGIGGDRIGALTEKNFDDIIAADTRADTSYAQVVVQTAVSATDNIDGATARIKSFITKIPKVGRTEILSKDSSEELTIIAPEQYRGELVKRIVADAKQTTEMFGTGYGVRVTGLERNIEWAQRGPLDLALFIPYSLEVAPR